MFATTPVHTEPLNVKLVVANRLNDGTYISSHERKPKKGLFGDLLTSKSFLSRYHVPRSWLQPTQNLIVLLEELGGDPSRITLVKRRTMNVCADAVEHHPMVANYQLESTQTMLHQAKVHLRCGRGQSISSIKFASFGTPTGKCGSFRLGSCHEQNSQALIEKAIYIQHILI